MLQIMISLKITGARSLQVEPWRNINSPRDGMIKQVLNVVTDWFATFSSFSSLSSSSSVRSLEDLTIGDEEGRRGVSSDWPGST